MPPSLKKFFFKRLTFFYALLVLQALFFESDSLAQSCSGGTQNIIDYVGQVTISTNDSCVNVTTRILSSANGVAVNGGVLNAGITNMGLITLNYWGYAGINNSGELTSVTNSGTIVNTQYGSASVPGYGLMNSGRIGTINNSGSIAYSPTIYFSSLKGYGIYNTGVISTIDNSGFLQSDAPNPGSGLWNEGGTISSLVNKSSGQIIGYFGIRNRTSSSVISTITNAGTITATNYGIINNGIISTLNNAQGLGNGSGALTYFNILPSSYQVIVNSSTSFGRLAVSGANGSTTFSIYGGGVSGVPASTLASGRYTSVLTGMAPTNFTGSLAGSYGSYSWVLDNVSGTTWDLVVTAASAGSNSVDNNNGVSSIGRGMRVYLRELGLNPVFNGGTLLLLPADASAIAFTINQEHGTIEAPTSGTATLSGIFSGAGGLTFTGLGTTVMSGANTYTGGTTVSSGSLSVSGPSPTGMGDVFVASAGTLIGTGTINGRLTVAGVLKPGNSPGALAATNTVTMNAGSTYQEDIAGATQASSATPVGATGYYSHLNVTGGQFVINPGATLTPRLSNLFSASEPGYGSAIYVPVLGDKFRIITADGITGRFSTLTQPAELATGTQFIAFYNMNGSNSIDLATVPTSYASTLSSSTTNAKEVASVLDQVLGLNKTNTATSAQDQLLYAASGQTAASLPGFAQALSGEIHAASIATLPQATQRLQQSVLARLGDYPMAPSLNAVPTGSPLTASLSATNPSGLPTASVSSNPAVNPNAANVTTAAVSNGSAWGEISYQRGDRSGNSDGSGYNNNLYQAVFGADTYVDRELGIKLGGGLALSNTTVSMGSNNSSNGNSTIQQGALFVYGKMPIAEDYVLDGMASIGLSSTNLSRSDITGLSSGFRNKTVMGNDTLVSVGISRPFEYSDVRLTPYARLTYQYVGQAAYSEGSTAAALDIASFSGSAVRAVVGIAAGSLNKDPLKADYTYRANVAVGADTTGLLNPMVNTTLGGFSSNVTTATAGSAFLQVGLYGTVNIADNAYAYAGVSAEARTGQTLYGGSVGLRMAF
jgi:autotransporter-associated beta strand protein